MYMYSSGLVYRVLHASTMYYSTHYHFSAYFYSILPVFPLVHVCYTTIIYRYNGGEGFVPGSMFCKFDGRQSSGYVKNVSLPYSHRMNIHLALLYVVHVQCTIIHNHCDVLLQIRRKFHNRKSTKIIPTMKPKW